MQREPGQTFIYILEITRPVQDPFRITSEKRVWIMVRDIDQDP